MEQSALRRRERRFLEAYLDTGDPEASALAAGCSQKRAKAAGERLLKEPEIQRELRQRLRDRPRVREVSSRDILAELCAIAFSDFTQYVRVEDGKVLVTDSRDLDYSQRAAIAGIKDTGKGVEIKLHDKQKALELLAKYLGLFEHTGEDGLLRVELSQLPSEWAE